MTSTELALIPPRLVERGVQIIERDGYRTLGIPPEVRDHYNVIFPTVELSQTNPDFAPMLREISLSLDSDAYQGASFHRQGECSLGKNGLLKLAEAAKVDIRTERIPASVLGPTERCGWKATATQRHSDGTLTSTDGSAVFDNEAELARIKADVAKAGKPAAEVEKRWVQKILKASELTETIAMERALRAILKLPHKLPQQQFRKPWLVLCYGFVPQTPEARAEAARAMAQLYGGAPVIDPAVPALTQAAGEPAPALPPAEQVFDDEPPLEAATDDVVDAEAVEEPESPSTDVGASTETSEEAQQQLETAAAGPSPAELAERAAVAAKVKPPTSGAQDFTLEQIKEKPNAEEFFAWALARDFSQTGHAEFNDHVRAFCAVHFPHLIEREAA